jgi:hypothetical protein
MHELRSLEGAGGWTSTDASYSARTAARISRESLTSWAAVPGIQASSTPLLERLRRKVETDRDEIARTDDGQWAGGRRAAVG